MKRVFAIVGVCLLAFMAVVSMGAATQKLALQAFGKPGSGPIVAFNLPKAGRVDLEIYDLTGRKVANLLENQYLQAGKHTYLWDARDDQGRQVSNGIYFVSLRADSEYRCIKLTYIARGVILSSPKGVTPEDAIKITEKDIIKAERVKYEQDARKLARAIAMALPDIQPALFDSIALAGDEMRHKVKLVAFTDPATGAILCNTGAIDERELSRILNSWADLLWIHVPVLVGGWTEAANPIDVVVIYPPYDEEELKVVYGYNRNGEELTFDPWIPPDYPVFAITHESPVPPVEETIPVEETLKETKKSMFTPASCCINIWRYWNYNWDGWPDYPPEFYAHLWIKNPTSGSKKKLSRMNFYEVRKECDDAKCVNCDCDSVPEDGDNGWDFGEPGECVGSTESSYSVFNYLKVYDDDTWGDDKAEFFNLGDDALPESKWYYGERKRADCGGGKDPYECWGLDLNLNFVTVYRQFSFVVIADPHIREDPANTIRLRNVVNKINAIRSTYNIKFVFVVGDIANYNDTKDPSYFDVAEDTLNLLHSSIEWCPIVGNHDMDYSDVCIFRNNIDFCQAFASQYNHLANSSLIQNWRTEGCSNFSFDYYTGGSVARYIHFLCMDWVGHEICGDCAQKHSSTYDFYTDDLTDCNKSSHGIYLFAHHPCVVYRYPYELGFCDPLDRDAVTSWLRTYKRFIGKKWSWFNGHGHESDSYSIFNGTTKVSNGLTTEACADAWPGEAKGIARLVEVYSNGHVETSLIEGQWP